MSRQNCLLSFLALIAAAPASEAQLTTGTVGGTVVNSRGQPQPGASVTIEGGPGLVFPVTSDSGGAFEVVVPYGNYLVNGAFVHVAPLEVTRTVAQPAGPASVPGAVSVQGLLLLREPGAVTEPLDFSGLGSARLPLLSVLGFSWTDTRYGLQGVNATDPYQPGRPVVFPDPQALSDVVLRTGSELGSTSAYGSELGLFVREPGRGLHGELASANTNTSLASGNLPAGSTRASLQQAEHFRWFTRDHAAFGFPVKDRADFFVSGTGQWASQTVPQAPPGEDMHSRLLFGNVRGRVQLTARDQIDGLFSGSRIDLTDWGVPAGIEALVARRMSPSFTAPWGFEGERETDHLDFLQIGWARQTGTGAVQARYGFSTAHLDTSPHPAGSPQPRVELTGGATGAPPLGNLAVRVRQSVQGVFQPGGFELAGKSHRLAIGAGWETAKARNRFNALEDLNLITAAGTPAFVVELNTPLDSRGVVRGSSAYVRDTVAISRWLGLDVCAYADFARGSLPVQASAAGSFVPERTFEARPGLIAWNSISPRVGLTISPPDLRRLVLRGYYGRFYGPLAGRYLDYGNANSLGGTEYQWLDRNHDALFQPGEAGLPLRNFGGPYSSIDGHLKRPYADEFEVAARIELPWRSFGSVRLFRRDEKRRIAAVNAAVPAGSFAPVGIPDPGPDGVSGTFDDQDLTVFAQDPATFGKDHYVLTNPPGLRMLNEGVVAEAGTAWRFGQAHASFLAVKSRGPANPGNLAIENDPGVVGALLADPNTDIHAAGRTYFDRAYVGKAQLLARLPRALGAIEWANSAVYLDGLVFGRRLLVTGLPQGPFLAAATVRGSPEGGNRAEYVLDWNMRLSRAFGRITLALDLLNVTNQNNRIQESDASGPRFLERLPVAIQPPRFVRWEAQYRF